MEYFSILFEYLVTSKKKEFNNPFIIKNLSLIG